MALNLLTYRRIEVKAPALCPLYHFIHLLFFLFELFYQLAALQGVILRRACLVNGLAAPLKMLIEELLLALRRLDLLQKRSHRVLHEDELGDSPL